MVENSFVMIEQKPNSVVCPFFFLHISATTIKHLDFIAWVFSGKLQGHLQTASSVARYECVLFKISIEVFLS